MRRYLGGAAVCLVASHLSVLACSFHTVSAEPTMVELLLISEDIAVARPDPGSAPSIEALRGNPAGAAAFARLDAPDATTLMARPDPYGPWQVLADLTPSLTKVARAVIDQAETWLYEGDAARAAFFADLMMHDDPTVRDLALRELDLLTYGILRDTVQAPDPTRFLAAARGDDVDDLQAIKVLLLGLSDSTAARVAVRDGLAAAVGQADWARSLGAHAVALVELDGPDGVAQLDRVVLSDPAQPLTKVELVVEALAIQRNEGDPALQPAIDAALSGLLSARPEAAGGVARQLGARADWSQQAGLRQALKSRQIPLAADMIAVSSYISIAMDELEQEANGQ